MVKNSLIADGCVIEGTVKNSILFRGVKVGKNTVIENSILFQDTYTGNNVTLNCVITDKNVVIRDYRNLSGFLHRQEQNGVNEKYREKNGWKNE